MLKKKYIKVTKLSLAVLLIFVIVSLQKISSEEMSPFSLNHNGVFTVVSVNANGTFNFKRSFNDYKTAENEMNKLHTVESPHLVITQVKNPHTTGAGDSTYTKIVAQPFGGFVQSYPYRKGSVDNTAAKTTLDIFKYDNLTENVGYVPGHYQMKLLQIKESKNSFVAEVQISGQTGWVDLNKVDLIPKSHLRDYLGNGGISLVLGGYENYYKEIAKRPENEKPYSMLVKPEYYQVKKDGEFNEIRFYQYRTFPGMTDATPTFGVAPDWMKEGIYYSDDNIHYFSDVDRKKPIHDGSNVGEYYSYFQWLPVNSISLHNGDTYRNFLLDNKKNDSIYINESQAFVENGNKYGMNSLLIFAQANLESAYGMSKYAVERNNLFGWNAVDSNPDNAAWFDSVSGSIELHMKQNLMEYMIPSHWKHYGFSFGNMSSGVSYKYASDPLYGMKVANIAYSVDKKNGFKDYNNYTLTKLKNKYKTDFISNPNDNKSVYSTKLELNQIVSNHGIVGNFIKTNRVVSNRANGLLDLTKDYVYFSNEGTINQKKFGPQTNKLPDNLISNSLTPKDYIFKSSQNLRTEWNDTSHVLISVPKDTKIKGYPTSNGYVYFDYKGSRGYVKESLISISENLLPVEPTGKYTKYTVDATSGLQLREGPSTSTNRLSLIPHNELLLVEDVGIQEWGKVTYKGQVGFVHYNFLVLVGDINADKKVNIRDLGMVQSHLLKIKLLTGDQLSRADVDKRNGVNVGDLGRIQSHLLEINSIY